MARDRIFLVVLLLWILNATARTVFGIMTITEGSLLDVEVALIVEQTLTTAFLALGLFGFIAVPGLVMQRDWGIQLTLAVSLATIGFDIWGVTIQFTAAMGFIVPTVMIAYLALRRSRKGHMALLDGNAQGVVSE